MSLAIKDDPTRVQLTAHQARVLDLLAEGLTPIQIARTLKIAHKTVRNHISAALATNRKIGAIPAYGATIALIAAHVRDRAGITTSPPCVCAHCGLTLPYASDKESPS